MPSFRRFYEEFELLSGLHADSYAIGEHNLAAFVDGSEFQRFIALIDVGDIQVGGTVDVDFETSAVAAGTAPTTVDSITQLAQADGDGDDWVIMELYAEDIKEALQAGRYMNIEVTIAGAAAELSIWLFGGRARYERAAIANLTEIVT